MVTLSPNRNYVYSYSDCFCKYAYESFMDSIMEWVCPVWNNPTMNNGCEWCTTLEMWSDFLGISDDDVIYSKVIRNFPDFLFFCNGYHWSLQKNHMFFRNLIRKDKIIWTYANPFWNSINIISDQNKNSIIIMKIRAFFKENL